MDSKKAAFSVILSGILWGTISLFVKPISAAGYDSLQISFLRMLVAAPSFAVFTAVRSPSGLKIHLRDIWMFIGTGIISVVLFNTCYFYTIINSQASVAVVLLYTSPIFIVLISAVLFKEKITPQKLTALILAFIGCVLVAGLLGGGYTIKPFILLTGLGSGLFYALYTIFGRYALAKYDTMTVTAYTFIFGLIGSLPTGKPVETLKMIAASPSDLLWIIGVGIFCTVLPYFFYTWGLMRMESGKAAIIVAVEPLVGAVIGMTVFHESHSPVKLIGISLILGAIILLNVEPKKKLS